MTQHPTPPPPCPTCGRRPSERFGEDYAKCEYPGDGETHGPMVEYVPTGYVTASCPDTIHDLADSLVAVRVASEGERECVRWFASIMERELKANDHKGGWERDRIVDLLNRVYDEASELNDAINCPGGARPERIIKEAADVANFAMMIADNAHAALLRSRSEPRS